MTCTCPGWCFFNPGQHHVNCTCKASEHEHGIPECQKCGMPAGECAKDCPDAYYDSSREGSAE